MKNHYAGREMSRAFHGWSIEEEIRWEINQLESYIEDVEIYCDRNHLSYEAEGLPKLKERLTALHDELEEIKHEKES